MNNSALHRDGNRLGSVAGPKLFHDVFDVDLDRLFGDEEPFTNVAVTVAATDLLQHLDFTGSQRFIAVVFEHARSYLLGNSFLSRVHLPDRFNHFFGRHALEHVAARSGLKRPVNLDVSLRRCEHYEASVRKLIPDGDHRVDAGHVGKPDVHQHDVGLLLSKRLDGVPTVGGFSDQGHIRLVVDQSCNALAYKGVVIYAENANAYRFIHLLLPAWLAE